ncbi:MAG: translation elongation factor Ts [Candidatus Jacksonbacteria bacterium]|jgi:elongation factor Ts|nr:translation elongation factor Ts [Candidatus Jacksonbacteria bacterium]MBT6034174.1 translation elongation factor Ts [Candidatus Jacksonbacteria bacterium]MBT6301039.1 translation elongation factor Ts [Candidatus Jacksonbacteria bacterium]MBT6756855.1 translation elongation factor Ts [Candidatus Jacksonbacteria bacterium]MBT6955041.1 translation elongation factor Ts [Candidatus Jacksonbacteria bacterium]
MIKATDVKDLRDKTGAGMMDAKKALEESGGDLEKAIEWLRKKGQQVAAKKQSERTAHEGMIESYIHGNSRVGVLLELNCETDFVARNEEFKALAHDIAMHIAAMSPEYISAEDIPADVIEKEKEIEAEKLKTEGKPEEMIEKILEGKVKKFAGEVCLLDQVFVKDDKTTVEDVVNNATQKLGEKIVIRRFVRYSLEGDPIMCSIKE